MTVTRVRTFYPADPMGVVPGGVDTFIRGIIKWAPADLEFSLVGMTTDDVARPRGRWTRCSLGRREFEFYPVVRVKDAGQRSRIPLSLRYTLSTLLKFTDVTRDFDVFEFHRVEPALLFGADDRPKNAFFHQDMAVIRAQKADILWRRMPKVYAAIERRTVAGFSSVWCVREEGVRSLRSRYPQQASAIQFIPTWVDEEVFSPLDWNSRTTERARIAQRLALNPHAEWIVSVGRLDTQKDPDLLLSGFARLASKGRDAVLLVIGDGVLKARLETRVAEERLDNRVRFLGLLAAHEIATVLAVSDAFALSSAYEGMPMAVLEALGSGLPVATTEVGEVRRVVRAGENGCIARDRSADGFAACLEDVLEHSAQYRGDAAVSAVKAFRPSEVLSPVYDRYRELRLRYRPR